MAVGIYVSIRMHSVDTGCSQSLYLLPIDYKVSWFLIVEYILPPRDEESVVPVWLSMVAWQRRLCLSTAMLDAAYSSLLVDWYEQRDHGA